MPNINYNTTNSADSSIIKLASNIILKGINISDIATINNSIPKNLSMKPINNFGELILIVIITRVLPSLDNQNNITPILNKSELTNKLRKDLKIKEFSKTELQPFFNATDKYIPKERYTTDLSCVPTIITYLFLGIIIYAILLTILDYIKLSRKRRRN